MRMTSIEQEAAAAVAARTTQDTPAPPEGAGPGSAVALPVRAVIDRLLDQHTTSVEEWAISLLTDADMESSDPEDATLNILAQILTARSSAEVLASLELTRAKDMCGGEPGGHSPLLEIRGVRPMASTFEDGAKCYVIVSAIYVHNGETVSFTTGAKAVQAAILAHVANGWMPFQALLEIRRKPTAAGFYPLNLVAGG
jgi:hypothetical protein